MGKRFRFMVILTDLRPYSLRSALISSDTASREIFGLLKVLGPCGTDRRGHQGWSGGREGGADGGVRGMLP